MVIDGVVVLVVPVVLVAPIAVAAPDRLPGACGAVTWRRPLHVVFAAVGYEALLVVLVVVFTGSTEWTASGPKSRHDFLFLGGKGGRGRHVG